MRNNKLEHEITSVTGIAKRSGILVGDKLLSINGEKIIDEIDYQALSVESNLKIELHRNDEKVTLQIHKPEGEPLGVRFGKSMELCPRICTNKCTFCFIDQMPPNLRKTLYVKDDDWRYSLMMGNFVTLTNVSDTEFERILKRKPSPLFISVHTTDPELRKKMMLNRKAGEILIRLKQLAQAGIRFHCQVVVCPGYNDKEALTRTLNDLLQLAPATQTVALVPIGLTKFRDGLAPATPFNEDSARELIAQVAPFQANCLKTMGTSFVFPSDEFFCIANLPLPEEEWYEGFPQIENGVGMLRKFESELVDEQSFDDEEPPTLKQRIIIPTGKSFAPHLRRLADRFKSDNLELTVVMVPNKFFGETITVTGLLTGGDVLDALTDDLLATHDRVVVSDIMLRHERDLFLDDMSIDTFRKSLPLPLSLIGHDGASLYHALQGRFEEQ